MTMRRLSLIAFPIAALAAAGATRAAGERSWDGAWTGSLRNISPISVTIEGDKVVSYAVKGARLPIAYGKVAPGSVSFGDRDNYSMTLTRTGEATALARYHGRMGFATATLTRQ
jgi:hypothetical protein